MNPIIKAMAQELEALQQIADLQWMQKSADWKRQAISKRLWTAGVGALTDAQCFDLWQTYTRIYFETKEGRSMPTQIANFKAALLAAAEVKNDSNGCCNCCLVHNRKCSQR